MAKTPPTARPGQIGLLAPDEDLGTAMKELTEPQRRFVTAYVENGGSNEADAAYRAGYGSTPGDCASIANRMLRAPRILTAIREEADKRLKSGAILASSVLVEIASNRMHRDQYKAAVELLNRAGLVVEGVSRVIVEDHRTEEEIVRRIADLADKLGIDPKKLLGSDVVDAEFTVEPGKNLTAEVAKIHNAGDEWQAAQVTLDQILELSE